MSKQSIRSQVSKQLLTNVNRTSEKLVSEAARIVLQSTQASQCLILDRKAVKALQTGFEAGIGRNLSANEGKKYRTEVKKYFVQSSKPFPDIPGKSYFVQILRRNKLELGRNIFFLGISFDTIKDRYHAFNINFIEKTKSLSSSNLSYDKKAPGQVTQFDHGAEGTNVASLGGGAQAFQVGVERGFNPDALLKIAGNNLTAIIDERFTELSSGSKSKLQATLYDVIVNWEQVITAQGKLNAGVGIIVRPVPTKENLGRSGIEKKEYNALLDAIDSAVTGIPWADLEGSSTLKEKAAKVVITNFTKDLKKLGAKVTLDPKLKSAQLKTKTNVKDTTKGGSVSVSPARKRGGAKARPMSRNKKPEAQYSKNSMYSLLAYINQRLPGKVVQNMGSPRLNNQTGRFAASVRATDIALTPRGYPSVGYTYQTDPYQVFESTSGSKFSSIERDPRRLIDLSIREIAAEMAVTRLFTRRV